MVEMERFEEKKRFILSEEEKMLAQQKLLQQDLDKLASDQEQ